MDTPFFQFLAYKLLFLLLFKYHFPDPMISAYFMAT